MYTYNIILCEIPRDSRRPAADRGNESENLNPPPPII